MKYLLLLFLVLTGCYVEVDEPRPRVLQVYDCYTYEYCDGVEIYDDFSICTNLAGALDVEDDFVYSCSNYGYYNCFSYSCDADCDPSGLVCR